MRLFPALILCALISACDTPSLEFNGISPVATEILGDKILVYHKGTRAQAVRTNTRRKSQRDGAMERLIEAISNVTKCEVRERSVRGDAVLISASLKCASLD